MISDEILEISKVLKNEDQKDNEDKFKKLKCSNCGFIIRFQHKHRPLSCPECENKFWDKPIDEFKLSMLQEEYLRTRDTDVLAEIYKTLKPYIKRMIVKKVKNKFYFNKDLLEMKAHDATNKIIIYYLEKPEFRIDNSFGGYCSGPILNVLYGDKVEDHDSLNSMIDSESELMDCISGLSSEVRERMIVNFEPEIDNRSNVTEHLADIIRKSSIKIRKHFSTLNSILTLVGIKNKIKGITDSNLHIYYLYAGLNTKKNVDKTMFFMYKKLKELSQ